MRRDSARARRERMPRVRPARRRSSACDGSNRPTGALRQHGAIHHGEPGAPQHRLPLHRPVRPDVRRVATALDFRDERRQLGVVVTQDVDHQQRARRSATRAEPPAPRAPGPRSDGRRGDRSPCRTSRRERQRGHVTGHEHRVGGRSIDQQTAGGPQHRLGEIERRDRPRSRRRPVWCGRHRPRDRGPAGAPPPVPTRSSRSRSSPPACAALVT